MIFTKIPAVHSGIVFYSKNACKGAGILEDSILSRRLEQPWIWMSYNTASIGHSWVFYYRAKYFFFALSLRLSFCLCTYTTTFVCVCISETIL